MSEMSIESAKTPAEAPAPSVVSQKPAPSHAHGHDDGGVARRAGEGAEGVTEIAQHTGSRAVRRSSKYGPVWRGDQGRRRRVWTAGPRTAISGEAPSRSCSGLEVSW